MLVLKQKPDPARIWGFARCYDGWRRGERGERQGRDDQAGSRTPGWVKRRARTGRMALQGALRLRGLMGSENSRPGG